MNELFEIHTQCRCGNKFCRKCNPPLARTTDPVTSHNAAKTLVRETMMKKLMEAYAEAGTDGLTAEEASSNAGYSPADGAWKRVSDLITAGLLEDSGHTRKGSSGRQQRVLILSTLGTLV